MHTGTQPKIYHLHFRKYCLLRGIWLQNRIKESWMIKTICMSSYGQSIITVTWIQNQNQVNQSVLKAEVIMTLNEFYVKVKYQNKIFSCRPQLPTEILKIESDCGGWVHKFHIFLEQNPRNPFLSYSSSHSAIEKKQYSSWI